MNFQFFGHNKLNQFVSDSTDSGGGVVSGEDPREEEK